MRAGRLIKRVFQSSEGLVFVVNMVLPTPSYYVSAAIYWIVPNASTLTDPTDIALRARVQELVLAPDLRRTFPSRREGTLGPSLQGSWPAEETAVVERGALVLYERPLTSEIGMWALLRRPNLGPPSLLAVGEWGFHEAAFRVGNRPLSPEEAARFPSASAGPVRR